MNFKEFFLAQELAIRGVMDLKDVPVIPSTIPKTGFRNSGATKMNMAAPIHPYKPTFRTGKSLLK